MRYAFAPVAFGLSANALVARNAPTCVQLKASGGASGVLGQLGDGQNRIGGDNPTGCYCLSGDGGFTDANGRGCILTPPTTQFQCDVGATATTGFALGDNGGVTYNGSGKFYACPVNDKGEYNIYTQPAPDQEKCVEISLGSAGSCGAGNGASKSAGASKPAQTQPAYPTGGKPGKPSMTGYPQQSKPAPKPSQPAPEQCVPTTVVVTVTQPAPQQPKPSAPAPEYPSAPAPKPSAPAPKPSAPAPKPSAPAGSCPTDLNGNYEYPHLIVPVDSENPDKSYGTSYNGKVDSHTCTIFNFDIPASYAGKKCTSMFLFPKKEDLETSSYDMSGSGKCTISKMKGPANEHTTYANQPAKDHDVASVEMMPGNSYTVDTGDCAAGQTVSYEICGSGDFSLDYFQDYNPSPIGMYVRQC